jgi:hypothetical protein
MKDGRAKGSPASVCDERSTRRKRRRSSHARASEPFLDLQVYSTRLRRGVNHAVTLILFSCYTVPHYRSLTLTVRGTFRVVRTGGDISTAGSEKSTTSRDLSGDLSKWLCTLCFHIQALGLLPPARLTRCARSRPFGRSTACWGSAPNPCWILVSPQTQRTQRGFAHTQRIPIRGNRREHLDNRQQELDKVS